jgi:hypothetical protein
MGIVYNPSKKGEFVDHLQLICLVRDIINRHNQIGLSLYDISGKVVEALGEKGIIKLPLKEEVDVPQPEFIPIIDECPF